jgi:hypothetical protein
MVFSNSRFKENTNQHQFEKEENGTGKFIIMDEILEENHHL